MINLYGQRVLVTGASSMLAKAVIPILRDRGALVIPSYREDYDLTNIAQAQWCIKDSQADLVVHLAGLNGNVQMNLEKPETIFYNTSLINLNVIHSCIGKVKKIVSVLASCAYPPLDVLTENDLWRGDCHPTVFCHGQAKRILDIHARAVRKQYGLNAVNVIINNMMGPNDHFNAKGKVVSQFIKKYVHAKQQNLPQVINWGSGVEKREITYVKDAAEAMVQTLEKYDDVVPLNISSDHEFTIKELSEKISNIVGYQGETVWDTSKPDGQMRKKLDTNRMHQFLNLKITPFDQALSETINWYINNQQEADSKVIKW